MMLLMCFEDRCLTAAGTLGQVCPVSSWGSGGRGDISFWRPLHLYYIEVRYILGFVRGRTCCNVGARRCREPGLRYPAVWPGQLLCRAAPPCGQCQFCAGLGWVDSQAVIIWVELGLRQPLLSLRTSVREDHSAGRGVSQCGHEARVRMEAWTPVLGPGPALDTSGGGPATWTVTSGTSWAHSGRQWAAAVSWHLHLTSINFQVFTSLQLSVGGSEGDSSESGPRTFANYFKYFSTFLTYFWCLNLACYERHAAPSYSYSKLQLAMWHWIQLCNCFLIRASEELVVVQCGPAH